MENERIFIIGDIHGCLGMLKRLVDKIDWRPDRDRLIFLGDYIDRGEDSRGVIDFILDLSRVSRGVECILGNHETIFLDFLSGQDMRTFLANGGAPTLQSYRKGGWDEGLVIPREHLEFLKSLRPWVELEDYYVVHAGLRPGVELTEQDPDDLVWIRDPFIYSEHDFGKRVIFGHTPFSEPLIMANKIGLDTGAVYGNKLTAVELPAMRFYQV